MTAFNIVLMSTSLHPLNGPDVFLKTTYKKNKSPEFLYSGDFKYIYDLYTYHFFSRGFLATGTIGVPSLVQSLSISVIKVFFLLNVLFSAL